MKKDQFKTINVLLNPYKQHKTGSTQQLQQQRHFNHSVLATHKSLSPIHVSPHSAGKYQDILTELESDPKPLITSSMAPVQSLALKQKNIQISIVLFWSTLDLCGPDREGRLIRILF